MKQNVFKRWREGMKNLTPAQLLHARMVGHLGGAIGLTIAIVIMFIRGIWYFSIFIFFMIWLQVVAYIGVRQQYKALINIMDEMESKKPNGGAKDGH